MKNETVPCDIVVHPCYCVAASSYKADGFIKDGLYSERGQPVSAEAASVRLVFQWPLGKSFKNKSLHVLLHMQARKLTS